MPGPEVPPTPLVFVPEADWPQMKSGELSGKDTQALVEDNGDLQEYGISLFAAAVQGDDTYPVFNNTNLKFTSGAWNYDNLKYWIPGTRYTFAAFAPFAGSTGEGLKISNGNIAVSNTDTDPSVTITNYISGNSGSADARNEDLLYARYVRDNTLSSDFSAVPLQFNHLLACITFYIRNTTGNDIASVDNIKLTGLKYKGAINISLSGATINATEDVVGPLDTYFAGSNRPVTGESTPFLPKGMSENDYKYLFDCGSLTVLPQRVYGNDIKINFTINYSNGSRVNYTGNLSNIDDIASWDAGKKYRYNITISSKEIIFQVTEIPWIEHEIEL